jgi:hypothetical protein
VVNREVRKAATLVTELVLEKGHFDWPPGDGACRQ